MTEDQTGRKPDEPSSGPPDGRDGMGGFGERPPEREAGKKRTDFPLLEFVVVIAVIVFVLIMCSQRNELGSKAKEAETKQNLHEIELALVRYASDNKDFNYPPFLLGGDYTDSFVVDQPCVVKNGLKPTDWPTKKPQMLGDETCHDVLITEGYLVQYPRNPFLRQQRPTDKQGQWARKLTHFCSTSTVNPVVRYVGGKNGDLMVDIAGPPPAGAVADMFHGDEFILPPYQAPPGTTWDDPENSARWVRKEDYAPQDPEPGNARLPGNFYYYSYLYPKPYGWASPGHGKPNGYHLAAYGSLKNLGMDVYDATGDYVEQHRITPCETRVNSNRRLPGLPCQPEGQGNVYHLYSRGNPDGFKDGAIIVLDSSSSFYRGPQGAETPGGKTQTTRKTTSSQKKGKK